MTVSKIDPKIETSWKKELIQEFQHPYFSELKSFLEQEKNAGQVIYPPGSQIFNAFKYCPLDKVRVVIIGQDPYHGPGQAHGLCFSVPSGIQPPPSLVNIFKELQSDCGIAQPKQGDLTKWAKQGILLLNSSLTVRAHTAGSHANKGWETFTDAVIQKINSEKRGIVFLLWGRPAQQKGKIIDPFSHHVLTAPHPSPLSAHRGFFGCRHFSKTNQILKDQGQQPIDWSID